MMLQTQEISRCLGAGAIAGAFAGPVIGDWPEMLTG
jgi:hypothetical protein